jgi:tRNA (cytidine/uridine-2'-O-)-methyltransferase
MFNVILYEPEIPPNTGNIIRLCANTGARLHLIRPLGFALDDKHLRRAGLDYHEYATMKVHDSLAACLRTLPQARSASLPHPNPPPKGAPKVGNPLSSKLDVELTQGTNESLCELFVNRRLFAFTTKAVHHYHEVQYQAGDAFLFGPESRGLPAAVLESIAPERRCACRCCRTTAV